MFQLVTHWEVWARTSEILQIWPPKITSMWLQGVVTQRWHNSVPQSSLSPGWRSSVLAVAEVTACCKRWLAQGLSQIDLTFALKKKKKKVAPNLSLHLQILRGTNTTPVCPFPWSCRLSTASATGLGITLLPGHWHQRLIKCQLMGGWGTPGDCEVGPRHWRKSAKC